MTVKEVKQSYGSWELYLRPYTPREIVDTIQANPFGHIAVVPGRIDPAQYGDGLLSLARYVGVFRSFFNQPDDHYEIKGTGLAFWLGDEDDKGDVYESAVTFVNATFANTVRGLLPAGGAITEGTLFSVPPGTQLYSGSHQYQSPRKALTYVTDTFSTTAQPVEWRVNGDGTLDAGPVASLYQTTPKAILIEKEAGRELALAGLQAELSNDYDVEDYTTRVVLLGQGEGAAVAIGEADAAPTLYKDLHGNPVKMTRIISESVTSGVNADIRAAVELNRFADPRRAAQISTDEYDVKGDFVLGDYIYVFDPDGGFVDNANEVFWRGVPINPMRLRVIEMTWPIRADWTVAFRTNTGTWIDLSQYYRVETGATNLAVGDFLRTLAAGGGTEPVGSRPTPDSSVPAAPAFGVFSTGSYQSDDNDWTKAAILVTWSQPLNLDGSTITDGDHYEIRYRVNAYKGYGVRWGQLTGYRWADLSTNRWGAPISSPVQAAGEWNIVYVGWNQTQFLIQELTPGVEYEFQIRAVDGANPPHQGPFSASTFVTASGDLFAPSQPAAPVVASSLIAIQVTHTLGKNSGGTFNLESDLAYFSVHVGGSSSFYPDESNIVGKLIATAGMIQAQIPAVGTFKIDQTTGVWVKVVAVDQSGNRSSASVAVQATVTLIDDAHISDLTVSKVTAGTISAAWILAGSIKTANTGARVEIDVAGIRSYNLAGSQTLNVDSATGFVDITGRFTAQTDAGAIIRMDPVAGGDDPFMFLRASNFNTNRGHLAQFGTGVTDTTELSSKNIGTDNVDGGRIWLTRNGASMVVAPEGSSIQPGVSVAGTDVTIRGTGQVQITADAGGGAAVAKYLAFVNGSLISHTPSGGVECFVGVGYPSTDRFAGHGKMSNGFGTSDTMFYSNGIIIGAGFGAITVTYGPTMTSAIFPMYAISGATANFFHCITSSTVTSFAVGWSDALGHNIWIWVTRS